MADITKCKGVTNDGINVCKLKDKCYRYTAKADKYQSFFLNAPLVLKLDMIQKCNHYWDRTGR